MQLSEKDCPWIDKDLRGLMCTRDKLEKSAVKSKSPILMDSYREICTKVTILNIQLKKQYYTNRISACKDNMKESCKVINELHEKRSKSSNIDCLKESGTESVHKQDISNVMNSFFCSISKEPKDKIALAPNPLFSGEYKVNKSSAVFNVKTIELIGIRDAFAKSKAAKSFGMGNISSYIMKLAMPCIDNALAILFNTSIETSQFPDSWKVARVAPIFKEGDKTEKSNYRPISVLPFISRLFQKPVFEQLYDFMEENGHFTSEQSGFLHQRSTLTCSRKMSDDW